MAGLRSRHPLTVPRSDFSARLVRALFFRAGREDDAFPGTLREARFGNMSEALPIQTLTPGPEGLRRILRSVRTIAMVGVSPNPVRPSHFVGRYLALKGYCVIPINPGQAGKTLFGQEVRASLADIPVDLGPIHMVDIFRKSEDAGGVVDEALERLLPRGLKVIWMQIGISDPAAAERARAKGVEVVTNLCPKMEYQRLFGELRMGGINTGIVSSRLR